MFIVWILLGLTIGFIISWFFFQSRIQKEKEFASQQAQDSAVFKAGYDNLQENFKALSKQFEAQSATILKLSNDVSSKDQIIKNLDDRIVERKQELGNLQDIIKKDFTNIANAVLEDRSSKLLNTANQSMDTIVKPLREKIEEFRKRVDEIYSDDTKERTSLKTEIEQLKGLNIQLSQDANNLVNALKGENKTQGNWGEIQLERILESAGLEKGIHYKLQEVFENEDGKRLQPDCLVYLPDNKHLIIDSKVSLLAFDGYFSAPDEEHRNICAKEHLFSIENHIKDLSKKNYQKLYSINPPDYVFMFIPTESAYILAMKENPRIWEDAFGKNIVLVAGTTLLATLRIVAHMWRQEKQRKYAYEIAKQSGAMYDKFVAFVEDLKSIGQSIDKVKEFHDAAMNKLVSSSKKAETLVGRAEKIRELGAQTSKVLPKDILDQAALSEE